MEYPKLRPVEAFQTEMHGRQVLCLRDPTHVAEAVLFVPPAAVNVLRYFDGTHSVLDIQAAYVRRNGEILFRDKVEELIATLDQHYFLESDRFTQHQKALEEAFRRANTRAAFLAGKSYPAETAELRQMFDQFLHHPDGPAGKPGPVQEPLRALIAPHIDYMRGAVGYAWAYRGLNERTDAELFVIFGTAHAGTTKPFAVCAKDFETPLGSVSTDHNLLQQLRDRCSNVLAVDDIAHRTEHSIELQVIGLLRWIEDQDREMLECVIAGDPDGFFSFVSKEGDRRRICGLSPTYALLHLMRGRTGQLLHYGQAADPQGVVSFCSVTFPA